ncbi:6-pyruvoyl tetrahydropterin synthase [Planctomycetes bacterium Pan216]|uniref:6-carboxy-5,6,7,8-tetrahydropterin synthase n=1 Tax=Kolteria novifilia TaxID=2527975 RepID=A0A518AYK5_9BACT|nr:6-pyruvoyl tetrahydropterin synthase [Planctomycetes bacterium Pan216]
MAERFGVEVTKDVLVFSAAHFITFNGNICERLHGHNWRVAVEVDGPLDENHYVFDFIALRDRTRAITDRLDHRVLLPTTHPLISVLVEEEDQQVTARFEERRWSFPREDCILLPIANTTAELIARWIGLELLEALRGDGKPIPPVLRVKVEENFGQWAIWEQTQDDASSPT